MAKVLLMRFDIEARKLDGYVGYLGPEDLFTDRLEAAVGMFEADQECRPSRYEDVDGELVGNGVGGTGGRRVDFGRHDGPRQGDMFIDAEDFLTEISAAVDDGAVAFRRARFDRPGSTEWRSPYTGFGLFRGG